MSAALPPAWRAHRLLLSQAALWAGRRAHGDDRGVVLLLDRPDGLRVHGHGDPARVAELVRAHVPAAGLRALTFPHDDAVAGPLADDLGLRVVSRWNWMSADALVASAGSSDRVRRLRLPDEAEAARAVLARSNPDTSADPGAGTDVAWWGADGPRGLVGVIGATGRPGLSGFSWHLHGLGVLPGHRREGLGRALAVAATSAGLAAGAEWVSLGVYDDNVAARRLYDALGFRTDARYVQLGPVARTVPSAVACGS